MDPAPGLAGLILAHGNNLDEIGEALAALVGAALLGALVWIGGRRDKRRHESDDDVDSQ